MKMADENLGGRPPLDQSDLDSMVHKLEPFLKSGQSLKRAALNAGIPVSTAYKYYKENEWFMEQIDAFSAYTANLVGNLFFGRVVNITKNSQKIDDLRKQLDKGEITKEVFADRLLEFDITKEDWDFIKWYATNAKPVRDEYGTRSEVTGKDGEPLIPESPLKEVAGLLQQLLNPKDEQPKTETDTNPNPGDTGSSQ